MATGVLSLDPDLEMFLAPRQGCPYTKSDIRVRLSDEYNRKPLPPDIEQSLGNTWKARVEDNPNLWDGSKFRIHSADTSDADKVFLNLGITGYRDFICTNLSPNASEFRKSGLLRNNDPQAHLADPLGVGALVHTADDYFILQRRSKFCGEAVGQLDVPGGHPEPEELVGKIPASSIVIDAMKEDEVVHEIFDSIHREICDEVNLPKSTVTFPVLLGIVRNTPSAGRPTAEFYSRCSLSSAEIQSLYDEGNQSEAEETTGILFVPVSALTNIDTDPKYRHIWSQMTASSKGAVILIRMTSLMQQFKPQSD